MGFGFVGDDEDEKGWSEILGGDLRINFPYVRLVLLRWPQERSKGQGKGEKRKA